MRFCSANASRASRFFRTLFPGLLAVVSAAAQAQAPHPLSAEDERRIDSIVQRMTMDEKLAYIGGTGFAVRAVPSVDLPVLQMSDGPVGVRSNSGFPSTTYAAGIGLAASWDRDLAEEIGKGIGRDARARGVHYMLGPGVNIYRSPRNGRNFEYFGEDPFLAAEMAVGYIQGEQLEGVSATVKHFLANNSEYLRHDSDSVIDERTLREIYLPAFEAAVKRAHVGAVMDSYNLVNGKHATENGYFNTEILRKEWGFTGTLMSDWDATYDAVAAANSGLDIEMPTGKFMNKANLSPALTSGAVTQATIDLKVHHILATAMEFGWLDRPQRDPAVSVFDAQSNATALRSARESAVLLKNTGGLLPLNPATVKTILVVGPDAYPGSPVGGGSAGVQPFHTVSLLEGLAAVAPGMKILYDAGLPTLSELAMRTSFTQDAQGQQPGLVRESFASKDLSGSPVHGTVEHINLSDVDWRQLEGSLEQLGQLVPAGSRARPQGGSQRYTGFYSAPADGEYLVALAGGGEGNGERVTIDGKLVIDCWTLLRAFEPHLTMPLSKGSHKIVVEAWQGRPGSKLRFAIVPDETIVTDHARQLATQADVIVVSAGFYGGRDISSESEGGDRTFDLPFGQDELIRTMATANPHTVVTLTSGGNVDSARWIDSVPALIEGWYGGQAGGQAMAEILFGSVNPSGHLPVTYERRAGDNPAYENYYPEADSKRVLYREGIFVGYRGYEKNDVKPLFSFGYGLSYTTFAYTNLKVTPVSGSAQATVEFDIRNTGSRQGATVAQLYVSEPAARVPRPLHELKGFARVDLAPGASQHITLSLNQRSFAYYSVPDHGWKVDPGKFVVAVGDSVASLPLQGTVVLKPEAAGRVVPVE